MLLFFARRLVTMLTKGITDYLQKKWMSREFHERPLTEADSIGVTIGHVHGLLVVFVLSVVVAVVIMFAEWAIAGRRGSEISESDFRDFVGQSKLRRMFQVQ